MIERLVVENFKAFGERQDIPLAPITLLFGGNSAGKSSVLQALLLMRQSIVRQDRAPLPRGAELVVRGDQVDLGSFDALVHRHERDRTVTIGWGTSVDRHAPWRGESRLQTNSRAFVTLSFDRPKASESIVHIGSSVGTPSGDIAVGVERTSGIARLSAAERDEFDDLPEPRTGRDAGEMTHDATLRALKTAVNLREVGPDQPTVDVAAIASRLENLNARAIVRMSAGVPTGVIGFRTNEGVMAVDTRSQRQGSLLDEDSALQSALELLFGWLTSISRSVRSVLARTEYLGPMRQPPDRLQVLTGEQVRDVGVRGEHVVDLLARRRGLLNEANEWFGRLQIPYELDVRTVSDRAVAGAIGEVHCLLLRDTRTKIEVAPTDVGFGVGQVLPVVVQSVLRRGGTLCIEQPEIHLHPALQAELGELFATGPARHQQFIIETHSEHLILRLQRLIRRQDLRSEDVSVLYVGPDGDQHSSVRQIRMDERGDFIDEWPRGFFGERFDELFGE